MAVRSVWWRGRAARLPPVSRPNRSARRLVDLLYGQDPRPDRRELDREGQTVEPPAQVHDRHPVGRGQLEPPRCRRGPLGEELDRFVEAEQVEGLVALRARQLQRRDRDDVLAGDGQRLPARGDNPHARRGLEDVGHEQRGRVEQVLAVVHEEQQLPVPQVGAQEVARLGGSLVAQVQGREDRVVDQGGVPDVGQLDQPGAVREGSSEIGPAPDREAGLADAARADEGDQADRGELLPELGELAAAADEAGRLGRQVAPTTGGSGHGDEHGTPAIGGPLRARSRSNHEPHRCRGAPRRRRLTCMTDASTASA